MAAECPFCGFRGAAYAVQMHIDENHEFDSPLPTRQAPSRPRAREELRTLHAVQPLEHARRPERGERFRLPGTAAAPAPKRFSAERYPAEEYPVREKRIVTKRYPVDERWIQCGRQGCGMYVARDVMNQHLDMHDMYEYDAEMMAAEDAQHRRGLPAHGAMKRLGYAPFDPSDDGAPSGFSRQDSFLDSSGKPMSKAGSLVSDYTMGSNGLPQKRPGSSSQRGGAGKSGGGSGSSSASKSRPKATRRGSGRGSWSRSSTSSKTKDKNGQRGPGKSSSGSGRSNSGGNSNGGDPSGNGQNGNRPGSNSGASQRGGSGGGSASNSGANQRGGGGDGNGGAGQGSRSNQRGGGPGSGSNGGPGGGGGSDTSGLEMQLAKLLLANRGNSNNGGIGAGPQDNAMSLLGLPNMAGMNGMQSKPGPGSAFSLSGVSTSDLMQAIQKKSSGGGGGRQGRGSGMGGSPSMGAGGGAYDASSRISSEAAGLLAAIVAARGG
ncbi:hypothetical protein Q7P37_000043 [Cladosporium fusiforme]